MSFHFLVGQKEGKEAVQGMVGGRQRMNLQLRRLLQTPEGIQPGVKGLLVG
jgi:hypothetical protein